ncbi:MAG: ATP phosphoribosyltransferase [Candidatus Dadabacteria bacterium]|nr:ATP phosphoribosyltransferase [Candidatus Dadabacteria bacterium]MCZ6528472.1 ATP phosphoribosyltransferase [Candidatus Dadabacteria bacterium]MCZ6684489.1 ATP phosphoribosyltransferase [Candidatus Dadabacteria bacterium]TDI91147.1 MAG: ATP phosphoribosyltransferase [Candidatus Dadabacteria bacterium]TDJ03031.1 MAG: ATP phosphoribosyltransferase [Candidatus Dadabacteria bacterium]
MITIAIARGRLLDEAGALLIKAGYAVNNILKDSRKLIFEYPKLNLKFLIIRPTDIPSYVEYGAADCGIVGKDTLIEEKHDLYEPLDLRIGKCKLVVAAPKGFDFSSNKSLRVATKYPKTSYEHFTRLGVGAEIIKLYGSVELAPLVGLSDVIVDLTASGETLRKNNLVEFETITDITARLVVNRVSMKVKSKEIKELIERLKKVRKK